MLDFNIDEIMEDYKRRIKDKEQKHNTIIKHTRMENHIFKKKKEDLDDMYKDFDYTIDEIQNKGQEKLESFPYLAQDIFNMLYKIKSANREDNTLTNTALNFNKKIVEKIKNNPNYSALKLITEGKDFESIEGTREFVKQIYDNLDEMLKDVAGDKGVLNQIEQSKEALDKKLQELETVKELIEKMEASGKKPSKNDPLVKKSMALQKQVEGITKKIDKFEEIIQINSHKNKDKIDARVNKVMDKALERVNDVKDTLDCFGTEDGRPTTMEGKKSLFKRIRSNTNFKDMAKMIGRMRRMAQQQLNKSFISGRGEKVGIEFGNKLNRVVSSELTLLANKETEVLFYKKYVQKKLKQYKERSIKYEGRGHVIYIVDQSSSTKGAKQQWTIALGVALMDLAVKDHRNFAFIPFETKVGNIHHVNYLNYSEDVVLNIAQTFLGGGTDFTEPIEIATKLLEEDRYEGADVVFVTDGHAHVDTPVLNKFKELKEKKKTKCVGVLLDKGGYGSVSDATIKRFCDKIYKTSEFTEDKIAQNVMSGVI